MIRTILAVLLMALPVLAQQQPSRQAQSSAPAAQQQPASNDPGMERIQKLVMLKYADPGAVQNLLGYFGVDIKADNHLKVIALAGRRHNVEAAEDAIKQLDVPSAGQKDIEMTVYFVMGTDGGNPNMQEPHSAIPSELEGTVATLKSTFPFKQYYLLDTLGLRTRSGVGADATGNLSGNRLTTFRVRLASVEGDSNLIRLDNLHAGLRIPVRQGESYLDTGVSADVMDVKEGQKLVVGRSSVNGPDSALFLVLIAKVAQ